MRCWLALFCAIRVTLSMLAVKDINEWRNFTMCHAGKSISTFRNCVKLFVNEEQMLGELFARKFATLIQLNETYFPRGWIVNLNQNEGNISNIIKKQSLTNRNGTWIILEEYFNDVKEVYLPQELIPQSHKELSVKEKRPAVTVQWTDLIVFDYLISNVDRVTSHCINHRWNAHIYKHPISNLGTSPDGTFRFFDNDAAFFHGYRIMDKYGECQRLILRQLRSCSTPIVTSLSKLNGLSTFSLLALLRKAAPVRIENSVPDTDHKFVLHQVDILKARIADVLDICQSDVEMQ